MIHYFVTPVEDWKRIDLGQMREIDMVKTGETSAGNSIYSIMAFPEFRMSPPRISKATDTHSNVETLATGLCETNAREYLDKLTLDLNSNRGISDGRPTIRHFHDVIADDDRNAIVDCMDALLVILEGLPVLNDIFQYRTESGRSTKQLLELTRAKMEKIKDKGYDKMEDTP